MKSIIFIFSILIFSALFFFLDSVFFDFFDEPVVKAVITASGVVAAISGLAIFMLREFGEKWKQQESKPPYFQEKGVQVIPSTRARASQTPVKIVLKRTSSEPDVSRISASESILTEVFREYERQALVPEFFLDNCNVEPHRRLSIIHEEDGEDFTVFLNGLRRGSRGSLV